MIARPTEAFSFSRENAQFDDDLASIRRNMRDQCGYRPVCGELRGHYAAAQGCGPGPDLQAELGRRGAPPLVARHQRFDQRKTAYEPPEIADWVKSKPNARRAAEQVECPEPWVATSSEWPCARQSRTRFKRSRLISAAADRPSPALAPVNASKVIAPYTGQTALSF